MTFLRCGSLVAAVVLALSTMAPALADGLVQVASFRSGANQLLVDTYTDGASTIGLIGIKSPEKTESYAFKKGDFAALSALWAKAQRGTGSASYVAAGSVAETDSTALDVLLLAGGPTVRFTIADAVRGAQVFDLAPGDDAAFDAALEKVGAAVTE